MSDSDLIWIQTIRILRQYFMKTFLKILANFVRRSKEELTVCMLGNFSWPTFFTKSTFSKISFRKTIRVSNSLDPDQDLQFVGPDLKGYQQNDKSCC